MRLDDQKADDVRRNQEARMRALEDLSDRELVEGVALADGVETRVPHRLGKKPRLVLVSAVRGAAAPGYINELRDGSADRTKAIVLVATDYGATVTVDVEVA